MDAYVMVILREIQLECHKQIGIERKGGRAIQEEELSPYPQKSDFDGELLQHQNLAQLVESTSAAEDPQISVEEAIENASSASDIEDDRTEQMEQNVSPRGRLSAFFSAVRDWHYEKREKQYKYDCAKTRADDRTYGFEYISDFIDKYIARLEKDSENNTNGQVF